MGVGTFRSCHGCGGRLAAGPRRAWTGEVGFTLVEVLIALLLVVVLASGVGALAGVAVRSALVAHQATTAVALAEARMEQLRGLTFSGGPGVPARTDTTTDLSVDPASSGGAGLLPSPTGTLQSNTPGYVDFLDAEGRWVGTGATPPPSAVFVRRWSIRPTAAGGMDAVVLQVFVTTRDATAEAIVLPGARLATVKVRAAG